MKNSNHHHRVSKLEMHLIYSLSKPLQLKEKWRMAWFFKIISGTLGFVVIWFIYMTQNDHRRKRDKIRKKYSQNDVDRREKDDESSIETANVITIDIIGHDHEIPTPRRHFGMCNTGEYIFIFGGEYTTKDRRPIYYAQMWCLEGISFPFISENGYH